MKEIMRENWADQAKFIGIMLMLLGHNALKNEYVFDFIYSFHMPLFFIISGYFANNKKEQLKRYFLKSTKGLLLPYLLFYIITLPFGLFVIWSHPYNHPYDGLVEFLIKPILGIFMVKTTNFSFHTNGPTWFLVVLFEIKLIFFICKKWQCNIWSLALSSTLSIISLIIIKHFNPFVYCRLDVALLAYPFYVFGYVLKKHTSLALFIKKLSVIKVYLVAIILFVLCYYIGSFNGHIELSGAGYGNNLILMYMTAILGTVAVYCVSNVLPNNKYVLMIGGGTIVVLGLHSPIQQAIKEVTALIFNIPTRDYSLAIAIPMTLIVAIIHIPIIQFLNNRFPHLTGKSTKTYKQ